MDIKRLLRKVFSLRNDVSINRENIVKRFAFKWQKYFYHKQYDTNELLEEMRKLGMKEGSCIFIHCAWDFFFNYTGNVKDFIDGVLRVIGPSGTLAMPAFPLDRSKTFNVKRSITGAGKLAEFFRRYPGVKRSANTQHSVCAIGPLSDYLLKEHTECETCWDENSPYYRLSQVNALIFCLGVGYSFLSTSVHCTEAINRNKVKYYHDFFSKEKIKHEYIDYDGTPKEYYCYDVVVNRQFTIIPEKYFLKKYFSSEEYKTGRISNLTIIVYNASKYIPKLIELGEFGIDAYRLPSKRGYIFKKRK